MRGWSNDRSLPITLDGEWELYPDQLLTDAPWRPENFIRPNYIAVPGDWGDVMQGEEQPSFGYGTYRLRILLDKPPSEPLSFWIQEIQTSSMIVVNGERMDPIGLPSSDKEGYRPDNSSYTVTYESDTETTIELLVGVSNYDHPHYGGITGSIRFGEQAEVDSQRWYSIGFQLATFIILMLHALYAGILYFINPLNPKHQSFLSLFLLLIAAAITIIADHDRILFLWFPISYEWSVKILTITYLWFPYFLLNLITTFLRKRISSPLHSLYLTALIAYTLLVCLTSIPIMDKLKTNPITIALYLLPLAWCVWLSGKLVLTRQRNAMLLLFASASVISSVLWGMLYSSHTEVGMYYPLDIIIAIIGFSTYWFREFMHNSEDNIQLNKQLLETDKLKDQFLANTSHELRTPLHGMMNIAQTLAASARENMDEQSYKNLELLIRISRQMSHLLDDLLEMAQLRENRIVLYREAVHLQSVASGALDMLSYRVEGKPVRLLMKIDESFPPVSADEKRVAQVLINLVQNAIKFTDEGEISVSAERSGNSAIIQVSDTGIGMDAATQSRIFLPYEQGSVNISSGIGLGLSICKQLLELHGSELTVTSAPGKGTVFRFSLPLSEASSGTTVMRKDSPNAERSYELPLRADLWTEEPVAGDSIHAAASEEVLSRIQLLAIDDDPVNLKVLTGILPAEHYQVTCVTSAQEALRLLRSQSWDLVLADVMMPHMSGYELTRRIREHFTMSELPILLLTARSQPSDIYAGFMAGANDYVTKPVNALELNYRIKALAALKHSVKERLRLEAAYLQAQIQPHFLFNTLNSIMALSHIDQNKMSELVEAFTSYLRISFDFLNAGEQVPIAHELKLVQAYLFIEKERFDDRLTIVWEVDSSIETPLPPLTIQPLVENAVKHGLHAQREGVTVVIRVVHGGESVIVEVEDNGSGMSQQQINALLGKGARSAGGIGIHNTNRRLMQLYGNGLHIVSEVGAGTTVSFRIPSYGSQPVSQ
ncbi:ATP-binding protein [Paenibacillus sp. J5C2022]|uniref:ATP-binding response regulator n=1 Tax=Paenibacillus sp. J5C2022 TaxID=2977129 RepID=UPI00293F0B9D|nr:ATP-binding protein [Paenibacillus sp. J5C2022]